MSKLLKLRCKNKAGQTTTELAVMGSIVITVLAFLVQQGFIYNARQSLEMYTFRKALQLSQAEGRGINLTVIRDVLAPSFFSAINRQRFMSSASVEYNPWNVYIPYEEDPEDVTARQLIQINEAMIRKGAFIEVPPTLVKLTTDDDGAEGPQWKWVSSSVEGMDSPADDKDVVSTYDNTTTVAESSSGALGPGSKRITKTLARSEDVPLGITFDRDIPEIKQNYEEEDWADEINNVEINADTIPKDLKIILEEEIVKTKNVETPNAQ